MVRAIFVSISVFIVGLFAMGIRRLMDRAEKRRHAAREGHEAIGSVGEHAATADPPLENIPANILVAIQSGQTTHAIKLYRVWKGGGLKEAKDEVERIAFQVRR